MNFRVIGERILVKRDAINDEPTGGLILPDKVVSPPRSGVVITVGEEVTHVKEGERIFFSEYAGNFLKTNNDLEESELIVMREDEVLAIEVNNVEITEDCS
jgi:co-chaperonin GroES (HSP10)